MLEKVNSIDTIKNKVKVTLLDIDDYGSVIPLKDFELNRPADESVELKTPPPTPGCAYLLILPIPIYFPSRILIDYYQNPIYGSVIPVTVWVPRS